MLVLNIMATVKQAKIIPKIIKNGGTITGDELIEAGYSKATAHNPKLVLKSKSIQAQLQKALRKHKITIDRAIKPISDGLIAQRTVVVGKGDNAFEVEQIDHGTRLKASAMSLKLLGVDKPPEQPINPLNNAPELAKAMKNGDEVELQRIVFNKKDEENSTVNNSK